MTISEVTVTVNGTHPDVSDWIVGLNHPDATQAIVWGYNCYVPTNFVGAINVTFKDGAPALSCANPTVGTFTPLQPLSRFIGKLANGNWTLLVGDGFATKTGTINSWSIQVCSQTMVLSTQNFGLADFKIYPNPNKGNFNVQFNSESNNEIKIAIYDISGRQIFNKSYQNTGLFSENLQLNNVQSGVYLVNVIDGDRKEVKKIIIE
ncbi:hypothetical protein D9M72_476550 [compost metagenome]